MATPTPETPMAIRARVESLLAAAEARPGWRDGPIWLASAGTLIRAYLLAADREGRGSELVREWAAERKVEQVSVICDQEPGWPFGRDLRDLSKYAPQTQAAVFDTVASLLRMEQEVN